MASQIMYNKSINRTVTLSSITDEGDIPHVLSPGDLFLSVSITTTTCLALLMNFITVVAVAKFEYLRTPTNVFVVSLALADGLLVITGPFFVVSIVSLVSREVCVIFMLFDVLAVGVSSLTLTAIAVDRYISLAKPFSYNTLVTIARCRAVAVLTWITSIVYLWPVLLWWGFSNGDFTTGCDVKCAGPHMFLPRKINLSFLMTPILVSCSINIVLYSQVFHVASTQRRKIVQQEVGSQGSERTKTFRGNLTLLKTMSLVMATSLVCVSPYIVLTSVTSPIDPCRESYSFHWVDLTLVPIMLNSVFNPMIVTWRNKDMRRGLRSLFTCKGSK